MPLSLAQKIDRLCAYDHCKVPLPWFIWYRASDSSSQLHRQILALDSDHFPENTGFLVKGAAALIHFIRGGREIFMSWRRMHTACRQGYGVGSIRQLRDLFIATFRYNHPAKLYYATRMFRLERRRWNSMFSHGEVTLLLSQFEKKNREVEFWTKRSWAEASLKYKIPSIPLAALASPDGIQVLDSSLLSPGRDLFAKPDVDYSSRGGVLLEWDQAANGWLAMGAQSGFVRADELHGFLTELARETLFVVQPRLRNAPDLADLSSRALVNVRIVTLHHPDGTISILMAALRFPPGDQPTSDVLGSTLCALIEPETGIVHEAECAKLHLGLCAHHPFNGARLLGRKISQWPIMREMALQAHAKIPFMPAIGWDLVATTEGVFILEANTVWHAYLSQQWGRSPLGETAWPDLMLHALSAKNPPFTEHH